MPGIAASRIAAVESASWEAVRRFGEEHKLTTGEALRQFAETPEGKQIVAGLAMLEGVRIRNGRLPKTGEAPTDEPTRTPGEAERKLLAEVDAAAVGYGLSQAAAISKVASEQPELYAAYNKELLKRQRGL